MSGRTKGSKNVDPRFEGQVKDIKALNPDWSAEKILRELKKEANGRAAIPKKRTIQRILSDGKDDIKRVVDKGLDIPWHLDMMPDLPPDAIAAIFEVQYWLDRVKDKPYPTGGIKEWTEYYTNGKMTTTVYPLTVREALWVARLFKVNYILSQPERLFLLIHSGIRLPKKLTPPKIESLFVSENIPLRRPLINNPHKLWEAAKTYADYQRLCDLAKMDFDTSILDEALRSGSIGKTKYDLFFEYKSKKEAKDNERSNLQADV